MRIRSHCIAALICLALCALSITALPGGLPSKDLPVSEKNETDDLTAYVFNGEKVKVWTLGPTPPTDREGLLKNSASFYILRMGYKDNYYNVNIPAGSFEKMTGYQREQLLAYIADVYDDAFRRFKEIFGYRPMGYKFNVTFGDTAKGTAFNRLELYTKVSNIFANTVPYRHGKNVLSRSERKVLLHEIGHGLFGITIGTFIHPKTRSIEEGFVDYISERRTMGISLKGFVSEKIPVSADQASGMKGLTQLDIETSIWGKEAVMENPVVKGYHGRLHHLFGLEFIEAFIETFGMEPLAPFLRRLRATENDLSPDDFGTKQVRNILGKMGYSDKDISDFEDKLHTRLRKNIFGVN